MKKLVSFILALLLCVSLLPALPQTGCAAVETAPTAGLTAPQDPGSPENPEDPEDTEDPGKPGEVQPQNKETDLWPEEY